MDKKLKLNCSLDNLLEGGIEHGIVTEIYGEGGTGKTNICIQASKSCAMEGKKVVYIDTEGISRERIAQVIKEKKLLEKLLLFSPFSLKEQDEMVSKAIKIDSGLIILDSANLFYRLEMIEDEAKATRYLTNQLIKLQIEARKRDIPVIITSQVYSVGEEVKPFAGRSMDHIAKTIIMLEKVGNRDGKEIRKATIMKHRSLPEGKSATFLITPDGIE
ncbi:MAG: DNA repair and recombination protein RadB [Thermoplasmatales archaeon]|nr:DNA repair and recombination protein RadB [Thermoplasmatales archaeon]